MKATYENLESSLSQDLYEHIDVEYGAKFESSFNRLSKELMRIMHQEELSKPLEKVLGNIEQLFPGLLAQGRDIEPNVRFVVVDQREPAFVVFTGIAKETNEEELEEIRSKIANLERVTMVTWDSFMATIDKYAQSVMLRNDYPDIHIMDGLVCLVASKQGSGAPWGLTWNGGIALTFNDYEHARRTFKSYKADPDSYKSASDPRRDPIHPAGKLAFGGCN